MQKLRILKQVFYLSILFILFHQNLSASVEIDKALKEIPYRDKFYLKTFFRNFFLHDGLGHVLFFDTKPACLTAFSVQRRDQHFFETQFAKGWAIWKKYENLFPHPNFIFVEEERVFDDSDQVLHIYLINKNTLNKCLKCNDTTFREILGDSFSSEKFITQLEQGESLSSLIQGDESLLGIIMGFGLESSNAFKAFIADWTIEKEFPEWSKEYTGINVHTPKKCIIFPVGFMGNPRSSEVQKLGKIYEEELIQLWTKYKCSRNTLKCVLEGLCRKD